MLRKSFLIRNFNNPFTNNFYILFVIYFLNSKTTERGLADLRYDKQVDFICDSEGNNTRSFAVKIVMIYNKPSVDSIYSSVTSEAYFSSNIDTENQDSVVCMSFDIIPGTAVSKKVKINPRKQLVNCWIFCDLHQKAAGTIVKKLQIGRFRKCQINFFKDSTEIKDLEK